MMNLKHAILLALIIAGNQLVFWAVLYPSRSIDHDYSFWTYGGPTRFVADIVEDEGSLQNVYFTPVEGERTVAYFRQYPGFRTVKSGSKPSFSVEIGGFSLPLMDNEYMGGMPAALFRLLRGNNMGFVPLFVFLALAESATILLVFLSMRFAVSIPAALVASVLFAFDPPSHFVKVLLIPPDFALLTLFPLQLFLLLSADRGAGKRRLWLFSFLCGLAFYVRATSLPVVAAIGLCAFMKWKELRTPSKFLKAAAFAVLGMLPLLFYIIDSFGIAPVRCFSRCSADPVAGFHPSEFTYRGLLEEISGKGEFGGRLIESIRSFYTWAFVARDTGSTLGNFVVSSEVFLLIMCLAGALLSVVYVFKKKRPITPIIFLLPIVFLVLFFAVTQPEPHRFFMAAPFLQCIETWGIFRLLELVSFLRSGRVLGRIFKVICSVAIAGHVILGIGMIYSFKLYEPQLSPLGSPLLAQVYQYLQQNRSKQVFTTSLDLIGTIEVRSGGRIMPRHYSAMLKRSDDKARGLARILSANHGSLYIHLLKSLPPVQNYEPDCADIQNAASLAGVTASRVASFPSGSNAQQIEILIIE